MSGDQAGKFYDHISQHRMVKVAHGPKDPGDFLKGINSIHGDLLFIGSLKPLQ